MDFEHIRQTLENEKSKEAEQLINIDFENVRWYISENTEVNHIDFDTYRKSSPISPNLHKSKYSIIEKRQDCVLSSGYPSDMKSVYKKMYDQYSNILTHIAEQIEAEEDKEQEQEEQEEEDVDEDEDELDVKEILINENSEFLNLYSLHYYTIESLKRIEHSENFEELYASCLNNEEKKVQHYKKIPTISKPYSVILNMH